MTTQSPNPHTLKPEALCCGKQQILTEQWLPTRVSSRLSMLQLHLYLFL